MQAYRLFYFQSSDKRNALAANKGTFSIHPWSWNPNMEIMRNTRPYQHFYEGIFTEKIQFYEGISAERIHFYEGISAERIHFYEGISAERIHFYEGITAKRRGASDAKWSSYRRNL